MSAVYDLEYVNGVTLIADIKILFLTVYKVLKRSDVLVSASDGSGRLDIERGNKVVYK